MIAAIVVPLFTACGIAGGFLGHRTRHATDGVFIGLITGPLGILALWFRRDDNWT